MVFDDRMVQIKVPEHFLAVIESLFQLFPIKQLAVYSHWSEYRSSSFRDRLTEIKRMRFPRLVVIAVNVFHQYCRRRMGV